MGMTGTIRNRLYEAKQVLSSFPTFRCPRCAVEAGLAAMWIVEGEWADDYYAMCRDCADDLHAAHKSGDTPYELVVERSYQDVLNDLTDTLHTQFTVTKGEV